MQLSEIFYYIFVKPLLTIYSSVVIEIHKVTNNFGFTIIFFALFISLVLTPIYLQMEVMGKSSKEKFNKIKNEVDRLKKYYFGRERYYYIQELYRQNNYHPIKAMGFSLDLILQVLVFSSVYYYLSHVNAYNGKPFLIIEDLGKPDALLLGLNILPVLMTLVNLISLFIYTKETKLRAQGVGMALLFLVVLYKSPAALVLYWLTNNLFSLLRNYIEFKRGVLQ